MLSAVILGLAGLLLGTVAARAKECSSAPPCAAAVQQGEELCTIPEIPAKDHLLSTTFHVKLLEECVPVLQSDNTWKNVPTKLRTYQYTEPKTGHTRSGFPGPILRLHKPATPTAKGDRLEVKLVNDLEPDTHDGCNSACPATTVCPDQSKLPDPTKCPGNNDPLCCCWANIVQQEVGSLNCFHGDNVTNLHFHGTHVSPQPPQDYALLELRPRPKAGAAADPHAGHAEGIVAYGEYQYKVDPLTWDQAEGTHWYHPHKHGSTSIQVANGMAGPLVIEGPFDEWLRNYYRPSPSAPTALVEKLIAMQQINQAPNFYTVPVKAPAILINGQVAPKITVQPGEVQRWRIVNANMQSSSQVTITFPAGAQVRQIAMDGIRFGRENYRKQPLFDPNDPKAKAFQISPGNRADFLVKAPLVAGTYLLTEHVTANLGAEARQRIDRSEILEARAAKAPEPPLFSLVVAEPKKLKKGMLRAPTPKGLPTPEEWPDYGPEDKYLHDITAEEVNGHDQALLFSMSEPSQNPKQRFFINNTQFDPKCVNVTIPLDSAEEWTVQNSSGPQHPFHIHTNPLQIRELGTVLDGKLTPFVKYDPPVWQDTVYLPAVNARWEIVTGPVPDYAAAQKICPGVCTAANGGVWNDNKNSWGRSISPEKAVCNCKYQGNGYALFRSRYEDFTGEFVLHCHFLGHEDRGMMFGVQTVCPKEPAKYGKTRTDGKPECDGPLIDAGPRCAPTTAANE